LTKPRTRILVVNPNISDAVTTAFVGAMAGDAPDRVELTGVTGTFGAQIVSIEAENVVAAFSALELAARHAQGFDGIILAISFDSGLKALQSVLPVPVIGITQATLQAASRGGRRVGVVFFGEASRQLYEDLTAGYGITPVGYRSINFTSVDDYLRPESRDEAVAEAIASLQAAGAEAIAIYGTAVAGIAARLQPRSDLPLFDGLCALDSCVAQIEQGAGTGSLQRQPVGPSRNLSRELTDLIAGTYLPGRTC